MSTPSTRSALDSELMNIRDLIVRMGSLVDHSIERANRAFSTNDSSLAQQVIDEDKGINDLRYKAEQDILSTMALQAPLAHDLRMLLASLIIANELERMGDYAEGIARTALRHDEAPDDAPTEIGEMADYVRQMVRGAMDAFIEEDVEKAQQIAQMDDRMDSLYRQMFKGLVGQMGTSAMSIERGTYLLWTGHNLERIGDRVTNICERVVFAKTGKTTRGFNPKGPMHKEPPV